MIMEHKEIMEMVAATRQLARETVAHARLIVMRSVNIRNDARLERNRMLSRRAKKNAEADIDNHSNKIGNVPGPGSS
jgi:hypothetical protein